MNLRQFSSTKKGQLILCCSLLGVVWLILLLKYAGSFVNAVPTAKEVEKVSAEYREAESKYNEAKAELDKNNAVKEQYRQMASDAWVISHDGAVETGLRRQINNVAYKQNFTLTNISSVRVSRVNNDFSYAEIDIDGNGEMDDVVRLLAEISKISPQLIWRRLDLRPDNRFRRNTGAGSANLAAQVNIIPETRLNFRGTLRVFCYTGSLTVKELGITRPARVEMDAEEL